MNPNPIETERQIEEWPEELPIVRDAEHKVVLGAVNSWLLADKYDEHPAYETETFVPISKLREAEQRLADFEAVLTEPFGAAVEALGACLAKRARVLDPPQRMDLITPADSRYALEAALRAAKQQGGEGR